MNPNHIAVVIALIFFAVSSGCYLHAFSSAKNKDTLNKIAYGLFIVATFLMTYLAINSTIQGVYNVTSGFLLVALLAWMTLFVQMFFRINLAGTFVAPLVTLISLVHLLTTSPHQIAMVEQPKLLVQVHIYASVIGEAFGILAVAVAILLIIQYRAMKMKQLNRLLVANLSLAGLEKALFNCIWLGFLFLTTGLILGTIYTQFYAGQQTPEITSKIIWALVVWAWYLAILLGRNVFKISGKKMANMTFIGFGIMALGFFGLLGI